MNISLFDFELPIELIAQTPAEKRDESRLLLIDKTNKTYEDKIFHDIIDYLKPDGLQGVLPLLPTACKVSP